MKQKLKSITLAAVLASLFAGSVSASPGAHGPNGEHLDAPTMSSPYGLARMPDGSVNIPKQAQRRMEIRTRMVMDGEHAGTVTLNGRVLIDPNAGGHVQAPFSGRITTPTGGFPVLGQYVKKGQTLAGISPLSDGLAIANQHSLLAEIKAKLTLAQQRVNRLETLEGTVPRKDIETARAELLALQGQNKALAGSISGHVSIVSPANGVISKVAAMNGQVVEAREELFQVVDPHRLLIEASVGDTATATQIKSGAIEGIQGVNLDYLGAGRSLIDGALPVTFRASSQSKQSPIPLAVGQPVTVLAQLNTVLKGIRLPSEAVVRNPNNEFVVWIKSGAERFIAQPIQYKAISATEVVVTKGLASENRVVVAGAALINQIR
jgi:membrane fusion protein, heavy metal efflux system